MWRYSDINQIRKSIGHHEDSHFDKLADTLQNKGVLAVFCLQEGCKDCEDLMVMIENMNQEIIRCPRNMIVIWGVKRINHLPVYKKEKILLKEETVLPSQDFKWEKLSSHGFVFAQSSMDYLIFEDDHSPQKFVTYVKNINRRLPRGILTSNNPEIINKLNRAKSNAIIVEYPQGSDEKKQDQLEAFLYQFRLKYKFLPYLVESTNSRIHVLKEGKTALTHDGLETKPFMSVFKKI